jgi:Trk K+ transport system NAD-binding subunit
MKTLGAHLASVVSDRARYRRQFAPFLRYLAVLTGFVLLYGWLFHVIMAWEGQEHSWFTGVYWALTVMSTLGFGDITFHTDLGRVFSSVVLLTGVLLLLIILPFLFIRLVYAPWLEQRSRARLRSLQTVPDDVADHVLICSDDPISRALIRRLGVGGVSGYLIEPDPEAAMRMEDGGIPVVNGDIDSVDTYRRAGADRARFVLANSTDTVNSNIVLTVRELTKDVPIAAIADYEHSIDILELSGATHVLHLTQRLGEHLANRVSAGLTRANVIGHTHDLQLAEFPVHDTPMQGKTIRETGLREHTGVSIVGVWRGGRIVPARADLELTPNSVAVVVGSPAQIADLNEILVIYDANPNPVIIIGGGRVGRAAARALAARDVPVHILDRDPGLAPLLAEITDQYSIGDAADRRVIDKAGIADAPSVLLTTHDDAMNIYLTVYCRRLNPEVRILTRLTHERNVEAIRRAGADFVLSYASLGVQSVYSQVTGRELVVLGEGVDLFYLRLPTSLAGKTLADTGIGAQTGLNVIAVQEDGDVLADLSPTRVLRKDSILIAIGSQEQRERFGEAYR